MKKFFVLLSLMAFLAIANSCQKEEIPAIIENNWDEETTEFYQRRDDFFPDRESYIHDNYPECLKKLQLDPAALKNMETMELLQVCMSFPYLYNFVFHNSIVRGYEYSVSLFNGFEELKNRPDALDCAIKYYNSYINYINSKREEYYNMDDILDSFGPFELCSIELLFVSGYLCNTSSLPLYPDLVNTVNKSLALRSSDQRLAGHISMQTADLLSEIFNVSNSITTRYIDWYSPLTVYTNNGISVEALNITCGSRDFDIYQANLTLYDYPGAILIENATCVYNCHSYAWYLTEGVGRNKYWINACPLNSTNPNDYSNVAKFWSDGTYKETTKEYAQKVFYPDGDHSAIVIDQNTYESKWGQGHVVRHTPTNCPYISTNLKYFTKDMSAPDPDGTNPNPNPNPNPDPIPEFCYGDVHWNMIPDPTPIGSIEDFYINDSYDPNKFTIDIFVSDPKNPDEPTEKPNAFTIISTTHNSARIQFNTIGTYYVCFYIYHKASGQFVGKYVSNEIYVN